MILVIQRVLEASVWVEDSEKARIEKGLLLFTGIEKGDTSLQVSAMAEKISKLRIFSDEAGKMNQAVGEAGGEVLAVSQFTLAADLRHGNRPGFDPAEIPEKARERITEFVALLRLKGLSVKEGIFGASMKVKLINDGPATFLLKSSL